MSASDTFVIAGGGLAGAKAAQALRAEGLDGRMVLATEEELPPYERAPLSRQYVVPPCSLGARIIASAHCRRDERRLGSVGDL